VRQNSPALRDIASAVPGCTSTRLPPSSGATKYSLAMPRSDRPDPVAPARTPALAGSTAATGTRRAHGHDHRGTVPETWRHPV
jgi:hypothetical protein